MQRTYQIWANRTGPGGNNFGRLITKSSAPATPSESWHNDQSGAPDGYEFIRNGTDDPGEWTYSRPADNTWTRESVTYNSSSILNDLVGYRNGSLVAPPFTLNRNPAGTISNDTQPYVIGNDSTGSRNWAGLLAEMWISNAIRSADRIATEDSSQIDPGAFITVGTPQAP